MADLETIRRAAHEASAHCPECAKRRVTLCSAHAGDPVESYVTGLLDELTRLRETLREVSRLAAQDDSPLAIRLGYLVQPFLHTPTERAEIEKEKA